MTSSLSLFFSKIVRQVSDSRKTGHICNCGLGIYGKNNGIDGLYQMRNVAGWLVFVLMKDPRCT